MDLKYIGVFLLVLFLMYFVGHIGSYQKTS